jgi:hypothetical protein
MTAPGARPSSPRPRARWRVRVARACIAISFCCLTVSVTGATFGHLRGWAGAAAVLFAVISIVSGLAFLRSTRSRP